MGSTRPEFAGFFAMLGLLGVLGAAHPALGQTPQDAISREFTVFNNVEPPPVLNDAVSREVTLYRGTQPLRPQVDDVTREWTVFNDASGVGPTDAVSREFTVYRGTQPLRAQVDAVTREWTVRNDTAAGGPTDAVTREITVYSGTQPLRAVMDVVDREFTLFASDVCLGDLNGDLRIDMHDVAEFQVNFGMPSGAAPEDGDMDFDGDIDQVDFAYFAPVIGGVCP